MADPMHQFEIQKILDLPAVTLPGIGAIDMSITNSVMAMLMAAGLVVVFFAIATAKLAVVPGRTQLLGEGVFGYIDNLVEGIIGHEGRRYFPFWACSWCSPPPPSWPSPPRSACSPSCWSWSSA
jgi:F-type H+-transporting ATPase subunit a